VKKSPAARGRQTQRVDLLKALADNRGVTLIEYALLLSLIAVVCVASVTLIGHTANTLLNAAAHSL
jgi:Flp pilus assembly pilin Flp